MTTELAASLQTDVREDTVYFVLQVTNAASEPIDLTFPTGQTFDIVVEEGEREIWRWSADRMFTQAIRHERIEPGETHIYEGEWIPSPEVTGEFLARGFLTAQEHRVEQQSRIRLR